MVLGCFRLDEFSAMRLEGRERTRLVLAHEAAVADHVGGKYGGQLALYTFFAHGAPEAATAAGRGGNVALPGRQGLSDSAAQSIGP